MKRSMIILLAVLSLSYTVLANTFITFGKEANGRQFSIPRGQVFRIQLVSNPTTGYDWHMDQLNLRYFRFINSGFNPPSSRLMGAPGKKWFEFKAVKAGNCGLSLLYYRSWEGRHKAIEKYKIRLNISK